MQFTVDSVWAGLLQTFGLLGTILLIVLAFLLCLAWLMAPIGLGSLYRKIQGLEQQLTEVHDRLAGMSRQQQVDRLRRDRVRKRPTRRR